MDSIPPKIFHYQGNVLPLIERDCACLDSACQWIQAVAYSFYECITNVFKVIFCIDTDEDKTPPSSLNNRVQSLVLNTSPSQPLPTIMEEAFEEDAAVEGDARSHASTLDELEKTSQDDGPEVSVTSEMSEDSMRVIGDDDQKMDSPIEENDTDSLVLITQTKPATRFEVDMHPNILRLFVQMWMSRSVPRSLFLQRTGVVVRALPVIPKTTANETSITDLKVASLSRQLRQASTGDQSSQVDSIVSLKPSSPRGESFRLRILDPIDQSLVKADDSGRSPLWDAGDTEMDFFHDGVRDAADDENSLLLAFAYSVANAFSSQAVQGQLPKARRSIPFVSDFEQGKVDSIALASNKLPRKPRSGMATIPMVDATALQSFVDMQKRGVIRSLQFGAHAIREGVSSVFSSTYIPVCVNQMLLFSHVVANVFLNDPSVSVALKAQVRDYLTHKKTTKIGRPIEGSTLAIALELQKMYVESAKHSKRNHGTDQMSSVDPAVQAKARELLGALTRVK